MKKMVQRTNKNIEILKKFKSIMKTKIDKMILFGSRARGNFREDSDFDVMIISDHFADIPVYKRAVEFQNKWEKNVPLELLCFTNKEAEKLRKNSWGIVREATNTGIEI